MKKIKNLFVASLFASYAFAQQPPTPNPAADPAAGQPVPQRGNFAWYRGGNVPTTGAATNNIFGTLWNSPIYFYTDGAQRMVLNGTSGATSGFLGLGTATPTQRLEVNAGNINIATNTNAYMLGSQNMLWHRGEIRNIFVGVNAGANTTGALAFENTFVGFRAGFSNVTGQRNTF